MNYKSQNGDLIVNLPDFSLSDTLDCGQCFRFEPLEDGSFHGVAKGRPLTVKQENDNIIFFKTSEQDFEDVWLEYFDLNTDYNQIKEFLSEDETIKKACSYAGGIRILKQDPWEALCTFIISQNNNIPRIKGIVSRLCENFGEKLSCGCFSFPPAEKLACLYPEDLAPLRSGFRAKYIIDAAQKIASGQIDLPKIQSMPIEQARKLLMTIKGVGPKVAECSLLFGFYKTEAFPIDVWMKRALTYYYKDGFPEKFRKYGGIAQQYIFHYIRTCKDAIPDEYRKK